MDDAAVLAAGREELEALRRMKASDLNAVLEGPSRYYCIASTAMK